MLDVHAPHKRLEGLREFFIHIFTITVGLVIATQIETFVEWRHHVHLAEEARASLHSEIQQNLADLKSAEAGLRTWRLEIADDLKAVEKICDNPNDKAARKVNLRLAARGTSLNNTAWKTAESTGALAFMPYDEARRYAEIYEAQSQLMALQGPPAEDVARVLGLIDKFHFHANSELTPEQASEMAEQLGLAQFHLAQAGAVLKKNIELNQAMLEHRAPKEDFTESLN